MGHSYCAASRVSSNPHQAQVTIHYKEECIQYAALPSEIPDDKDPEGHQLHQRAIQRDLKSSRWVNPISRSRAPAAPLHQSPYKRIP